MKVWEYFKERKGFDRLFKALKKKYISLGRYSGSVSILNITKVESDDLSDFFGVTVREGSDFKTSFSKIEKKLRESKFSDFSWEELFSSYFGEDLVDKKSISAEEKKREQEFFDSILEEIEFSCRDVLRNIVLTRDNIYQIMLKRYHKDSSRFRSDLIKIFDIISNIEKVVPTSLSILASLSGNPHFLDFGNRNSSLFFKLLARKDSLDEPLSRAEKIDFLFKYGVYVDSFSNYVVTYKLLSDASFVNEFSLNQEVLNLNLSNLDSISVLDTDCKCVYVFENPSMLAALKDLDVPMIIASGNPNYIVYKVIEKLIASGNKIYYNGDFDPEGLDIAFKLKSEFPSLELFCYDEEDYVCAKSSSPISKARLSRLGKINDEKLYVIKSALLENKVSGYQERNIKRILEFVRCNKS